MRGHGKLMFATPAGRASRAISRTGLPIAMESTSCEKYGCDKVLRYRASSGCISRRSTRFLLRVRKYCTPQEARCHEAAAPLLPRANVLEDLDASKNSIGGLAAKPSAPGRAEWHRSRPASDRVRPSYPVRCSRECALFSLQCPIAVRYRGCFAHALCRSALRVRAG